MTTVSISLRLAETDDAPELAALHRRSWMQAYCGIIPHRSLLKMVERRGQRWWRRAIAANTSILLLDAGDELAGYATFGRNRALTVPADGEIYELYLLPEYMGIGFGRRLFNASRIRLRQSGLRSTMVWALEDNESALSFYEGQGGRCVAEQIETFENRPLRKVAFVWE